MKKKLLSALLCVAMAASLLIGCGESSEETTEEATAETTEPAKVRVGRSSFGEILSYIATDAGYFEEEGLEVEFVIMNSSADGLSALTTDGIDIGADFGCAYPLKFMTEGAEISIFAGLQAGGSPVLAMKGEFPDGYKDLTSLKGKVIAINPGYTPTFVFQSAMMGLGLEDGVDFETVEFDTPADAYAALVSGKVDVAISTNDVLLAIEGTDVEIIDWSNYFWDETHVCCRYTASTQWLEENPEVAKSFLKAIIRAEERYYTDSEFVKETWLNNVDLDEEGAEIFTYEIPFEWKADPSSNAVLQMWEECEKIGFLEHGDTVVEDHINITLYKEALDELVAEYPDSEYLANLVVEYEAKNSTLLGK